MSHHDDAAEGGNTNPADTAKTYAAGAMPTAAPVEEAIAEPDTPTENPPPAMAGQERWRDPLVVVGLDWLARFTPDAAAGTAAGDAADTRLFVARLSVVREAAPAAVVRLAHPTLRRMALMVAELFAWGSDGAAIAALIGVTEATARLFDDGSAAAAARLAVALGLAPVETWPTGPEERVRVLLEVLRTIGAHPDAPAQVPRLATCMVALHREGDLPVPCSPEELRIQARIAGLGAPWDGAGLADEGWTPRLSAEELEVLPDEAPVRALFRRAALVAALLDAAEVPASAPPSPGESA